MTSTASGSRSTFREASEKLLSVSVLASTSRTEIPIASRHDSEFFLHFFTETSAQTGCLCGTDNRTMLYGGREWWALRALGHGIKLQVSGRPRAESGGCRSGKSSVQGLWVGMLGPRMQNLTRLLVTLNLQMETSPPREDALSRQVHSRGIIGGSPQFDGDVSSVNYCSS